MGCGVGSSAARDTARAGDVASKALLGPLYARARPTMACTIAEAPYYVWYAVTVYGVWYAIVWCLQYGVWYAIVRGCYVSEPTRTGSVVRPHHTLGHAHGG